MNILTQLSFNSIFGSSSSNGDSTKYDGYLGVGKFEDGFEQWRDAMKAVTRLPDGLPANSRRKMWLTLAEHWLESRKGFDWAATKKMAFNEMIDPEDDELDYQIVKDLHRTGCSSFSGLENDQERALLKRVLLAYARWNKSVGYCQGNEISWIVNLICILRSRPTILCKTFLFCLTGFNVIAAVILDVMDRNEGEALKVMIFLVDGVLPKSYFTDNLRDLAVDMAVFSDLLSTHLPRLHAHLDRLRLEECTATSEERPPLTDVFTMQWFLTLFATQLPVEAVLRVWDAVFLEGSEILIRTSLALWGLLQDAVLREIRTADDFYTQMGEILAKTVDASSGIVEVDRLMTIVYQLAPFPLPQLKELREKHFERIGSQKKSELEKWQKRLRDRHAQASQYLQLTPQRIHKSYKKVTGLVLPSVPSFVSEESMINHLKLPRQGTSATQPTGAVDDNDQSGKKTNGSGVEESANRHVLRIGSHTGTSNIATDASMTPMSTPSPTPSLTLDESGGAKPKSRSPQPRRMSEEYQRNERSGSEQIRNEQNRGEHREESTKKIGKSHPRSHRAVEAGREGGGESRRQHHPPPPPPHHYDDVVHHSNESRRHQSQDVDRHSSNKRFPPSQDHRHPRQESAKYLPSDARDRGSSTKSHRSKSSSSSSSSSSKALYNLPAEPPCDPNQRHPSPFPDRPGKSSKSRQRTEYGIKLGLYAPQKEHKVGSRTMRSSQNRLGQWYTIIQAVSGQ